MVKKFLKLNWFFLTRYIVAATIIFLLLSVCFPKIQVSYNDLGVFLQTSLTFGVVFVFILEIAQSRLDKHKMLEDKEEILNDFKKFMPRYILFLAFMLTTFLVWVFFGESEQITSAFRYFSLGTISITICGFYYLFTSALSYIDNL